MRPEVIYASPRSPRHDSSSPRTPTPLSPLYARAPRQLCPTLRERAGSAVDGLLLQILRFEGLAAALPDVAWSGTLVARGARHGGVAGHYAEFDSFACDAAGARLDAAFELDAAHRGRWCEFCTAFAAETLDELAGPLARVERGLAHSGLAFVRADDVTSALNGRALAMRLRATVTLRRVDPLAETADVDGALSLPPGHFAKRDVRPTGAASFDGSIIGVALLCSRGSSVGLFPRPRGNVRVVERICSTTAGASTTAAYDGGEVAGWSASEATLTPLQQFVRETSGAAPRPASLRWSPDVFPRAEDARAWRHGTLVIIPPCTPRQAAPPPPLHTQWIAECVVEASGSYETKEERFALGALVAEHVWGDAAFAREARSLFARTALSDAAEERTLRHSESRNRSRSSASGGGGGGGFRSQSGSPLRRSV